MKKAYLFFMSALISFNLCAQSGFPYQAVLRDNEGMIIGNQNVKLRFSLHQGDSDGTLSYQEEHQTATNASGLVTLEIGGGTVLAGNFELIDWSNAPYFMKMEADYGSGYNLTGSQELLSVPYAKHTDQTGALQRTIDDQIYRLTVDDLGNLQVVPFPKGYTKLIFQDEFNGTGLPDPGKWGYETGFIRNGEMQYYTKERVENVFQQDGILTIRCINNDTLRDESGNILNEKTVGGNKYYLTSGSIKTENRFPWQYGRVEVKVKLPAGSGVWPAIWMLSQDRKHNNGIIWPDNGEIDILEYIGNEPNKFHCAMHRYGQPATSRGNSVTTQTATTEWHVFALDWQEDHLEWFVDGKLTYRIKNPNTHWGDWPFDQRFYLILNFAFGGGWGGRDGFNVNNLPLDYQIDYVRIFQ